MQTRSSPVKCTVRLKSWNSGGEKAMGESPPAFRTQNGVGLYRRAACCSSAERSAWTCCKYGFSTGGRTSAGWPTHLQSVVQFGQMSCQHDEFPRISYGVVKANTQRDTHVCKARMLEREQGFLDEAVEGWIKGQHQRLTPRPAAGSSGRGRTVSTPRRDGADMSLPARRCGCPRWWIRRVSVDASTHTRPVRCGQ